MADIIFYTMYWLSRAYTNILNAGIIPWPNIVNMTKQYILITWLLVIHGVPKCMSPSTNQTMIDLEAYYMESWRWNGAWTSHGYRERARRENNSEQRLLERAQAADSTAGKQTTTATLPKKSSRWLNNPYNTGISGGDCVKAGSNCYW